MKFIFFSLVILATLNFSNGYCTASRDAIQGLEPLVLWENFYNISCVPRCSKYEQQVRKEVLSKIAIRFGLTYSEDKIGNGLINVPATPGYENKQVIALQTHLDMVCEKDEGTVHDFLKDPIQLVKNGEWISGRGTSLGADDGIGMATVLTLLQDDTAVHGPLELLFTVEEEIGLNGAMALEPGFIQARKLINVDAFGEGILTIGCAGGRTAKGFVPIEYTRRYGGAVSYLYKIQGGLGGHSGSDIEKKRGNAVKLLAQFLHKLRSSNRVVFQIENIFAGDKDNAIPRESNVVLSFNIRYLSAVEEIANQQQQETQLVYGISAPGLTYTLTEHTSSSARVFSTNTMNTLVDVITALPNGVIAISSEFEGLTETSLNLASVNIEAGNLVLISSVRSSFNSRKVDIIDSVKSLYSLVPGARVETYGDYPSWVPIPDSNLVEISKTVYKEVFRRDIVVRATHGGLETAIIGDIYPGIQMVSIGPDIEGAHSPNEKVDIESCHRLYQYLVGLLYQLAQ